jgi:hypothetical protein
MRSARLDAEEEEEHSLTQTVRLPPNPLDPCINIHRRIVSKQYTGLFSPDIESMNLISHNRCTVCFCTLLIK